MKELENGRSIQSEPVTVNNTETINVLLERIKELENEVLVLQQLVDSKDVAIDKLQDSVQSIESEKETSQMQTLLDALSKVTHLEEHIARRDQTIQDLENEIELNKSQAVLSSELQDILSMKDEELKKISENCRKLEEELAGARELSDQQSSSEEKKYKEELQKKEEVFESHSKFMKSKVLTHSYLVQTFAKEVFVRFTKPLPFFKLCLSLLLPVRFDSTFVKRSNSTENFGRI